MDFNKKKKVMNKLIQLVIIILLYIGFFYSSGTAKVTIKEEALEDSVENIIECMYDTVLATKYNPVPEQCGEDCLVTADGTTIDLDKLGNHDLKWVAVSRDLLDKYSMGDTIILKSKNHRISGEWIIHDVMHRRWKNKIDLLVPLDDEYEFHSPHKVIIKKKESIGT